MYGDSKCIVPFSISTPWRYVVFTRGHCHLMLSLNVINTKKILIIAENLYLYSSNNIKVVTLNPSYIKILKAELTIFKPVFVHEICYQVVFEKMCWEVRSIQTNLTNWQWHFKRWNCLMNSNLMRDLNGVVCNQYSK